MKRIFSIIAILTLIVSIGCQNENTTDPASFALEISEVDASAEGCDVEINYTITNHESGAVVLTSCSESWIKNLSTATQGKIKFSVAANYQKQAREARIEVRYTAVDSKYEIVVRQAASTLDPFSYEVVSKSATSLAVEITPADATTPYICRTYTKAHIDAFGLDDDMTLINYDISAIADEAKAANQSLLNYLQNIALMGVSTVEFEELVPGTEYVVYCYHIDLQIGEVTTGEAYRTIVRTENAATTSENITMSFEVVGAHVTQTVTTENAETYYFTECWAVNDFKSYFGQEATPEQIFPHRWNEQVTIKLGMGYQPYNILADLCKQGTQLIEYNELKADTEYVFYVFAVDAQTAFVASDIVTEIVTTESATESGMTIDIEIKNVFMTTADIYWTASDPNAAFRRSVLSKEQYDACGTTDAERFKAFEQNGYVADYTPVGSTDLNFTKGEPGKTFVAFAYGVDGDTPNTRIFAKEFTFISDTPGTSNIAMAWTTHYNLAEVAAVDAEHWADYTSYDGYALLPISISGVSEEDQVYYMLDTRPLDWYNKDSQWLAEVAQDKNLKNHYSNCYLKLEYEREYIVIAVAKDMNGNFGKLFKAELYLYKSDSADVANYSYIEVK